MQYEYLSERNMFDAGEACPLKPIVGEVVVGPEHRTLDRY
jgi:hypothetical protein